MKFYIPKVKTAHTAGAAAGTGHWGTSGAAATGKCWNSRFGVKEILSEACVSSDCFGVGKTEGKTPNFGRITDN